MTDNIAVTPGVGAKVATDEVTYSGDTASVQLVRLVDVAGAEGSKTVTAYTMPVTGTFWQATQPVSLSGSVAVTGTFWQATQPVSLASQPLPTGAATETSLVKLTIAQGATTSGQTGALVQGSVTTAAPSYTTGQVAPLSLDPSGQLRITGTVTAGGLNQGSTTSGQQGNLTMGAVTTAAPSYTTAQTSPLSLNTSGGLRVEVTTLPALAAGTATIGKLGANSGVDIGDVDVTSVTPGTAAGNLGKAEDAAHASGDTGVMSLAVRSDTAAALAGTTGDYIPLTTDSTGRLWVNVDASSILGAVGDAAWTSGNGTHTALLKTIAGAAIDTTPSSVKIDQTTPGTTNAVSTSHIGSTAVATGNGVVGAGVQRVAIASDNTAIPVSARQPCDVISFTPTLDTSIYASGDTLFVATALTGVTRANDERALLQSIAVIDKDDQKPAMKLFFFNSAVTFGTLNAAPSISDSDAANYLGHVDIAAADYVDLGGVSVACYKGINLLLESVSGATSVYIAAMLTAGTPTHTASGLVFRLGVVQS